MLAVVCSTIGCGRTSDPYFSDDEVSASDASYSHPDFAGTDETPAQARPMPSMVGRPADASRDDPESEVDAAHAPSSRAGDASPRGCDGACGPPGSTDGDEDAPADASAPTDAALGADAGSEAPEAGSTELPASHDAGSASASDCCLPLGEGEGVAVCVDDLVGQNVTQCDRQFPFPTACTPLDLSGSCYVGFASTPLGSSDVLVWRFAVLPPAAGALLSAVINTPVGSAFALDFEDGKVGSGTWGPGTVSQILPYAPGVWNSVEVTYDFATKYWTLNVGGNVSPPMYFSQLMLEATSAYAVGLYVFYADTFAQFDDMSISKITPSSTETIYVDTFDSESSMCPITSIDPATCGEAAPPPDGGLPGDAGPDATAVAECCTPVATEGESTICAEPSVAELVSKCYPSPYPYTCLPGETTNACAAGFTPTPLGEPDVLVWRFAVLPPAVGALWADITSWMGSAFNLVFEDGEVGSRTWGPGIVESILPYSPGMWNFVEVTYDFGAREWTLNVDGNVSRAMPFTPSMLEVTSVESLALLVMWGGADAYGRIDSLSLSKITGGTTELLYADDFDGPASMCRDRSSSLGATACLETPPALPPIEDPFRVSPYEIATVGSFGDVLEGDCTVRLFQTLPGNGTIHRCLVEFDMGAIPPDVRDRIVSAELVLTEPPNAGAWSQSLDVIVSSYTAELPVHASDFSVASTEVGSLVARALVQGETWRFDVTALVQNALITEQHLGFRAQLADETPSLNWGTVLGTPGARPMLVLDLAP